MPNLEQELADLDARIAALEDRRTLIVNRIDATNRAKVMATGSVFSFPLPGQVIEVPPMFGMFPF